MGTESSVMRKRRFEIGPKILVRKVGLEPPQFYPPDPKFTANEESTL